MGSPEEETAKEKVRAEFALRERPQRLVAVSTPLAVGKTHVKRGEYELFILATDRREAGCLHVINQKWTALASGSWRNPGFAQEFTHPAVCVSWTDAQAYARWLSARTGKTYRLLTEAEWEYAARAGTKSARWWDEGADQKSLSWLIGVRDRNCRHANAADRSYSMIYTPQGHLLRYGCDDGHVHTSPAGSFAANAFNLQDMLGNAWQWVADCFDNYRTAPADAHVPVETGGCNTRVVRGGSWNSPTAELRAATRFRFSPDFRTIYTGFRLARAPEP